jgi:hypothetical protein
MDLLLIYEYLQAWCQKMAFRPGGEFLPYDWVDEDKLLLFMKTQVAGRAPRKGSRLAAERKRKLGDELEGSKKQTKRRKQEAGVIVEDALGALGAPDGRDDEPKTELCLMYNSVRGYVSAIMELWSHQVSAKLHSSLQPHNVAVKALKTSIARGQHARRRAKFEDRGVSTMMDGYTAKQIPNMTRAVWRNTLGPRTSGQSFRTNLDFLFGHAMLLRQGNRLPLELPDLFSMDLPKEGQKGKGWCFVVVMDQGKYYPFLSPFTYANNFYFYRENKSTWQAGVRLCSTPSRSSIVSRWRSCDIPFLAVAPLWGSLPLLPY